MTVPGGEPVTSGEGQESLQGVSGVLPPLMPTPTVDEMGRIAASALAEIRGAEEREYEDFSARPEYSTSLVRAFASYQAPSRFVEGQLVQWKTFLKNRRFPAYGRPAIVVKYLDPDEIPVLKDNRYSESEDIVLGILDGEGNFRTYSFSSKRFQLYEIDGS